MQLVLLADYGGIHGEIEKVNKTVSFSKIMKFMM